MINIIDTFEEIVRLAEKGTFSMDKWERYAASISESLPPKLLEDAKDYDFDSQIFPILESALNSPSQAERAHRSFLKVTDKLPQRFYEVFGFEPDVQIVLYLGLCSGAGWATELDGKKSVLLGLEKIVELDWCSETNMVGLVYHELGHMVHDTLGTLRVETKKASDRSAWQLFQEGVAMYCEQLLCGRDDLYHQDKNGWLAWCREHKKELFSEYFRRMDLNESTQDFFGDWCSYRGHSDTGYYLGCEFVKDLVKKYSFQKTVRMDLNQVKEGLNGFQASLCPVRTV